MRYLVIALGVLGARALAADPVRVEASRDAMGGTFSVILYGTDRARLQGAAAEALEEAVRLDQLLSNYRPSSEWSRVNREAGKGPVAVSPELFDLLSACVAYSRATEGTFDISVGPLMKIWGFYKGSGRLPHRAEVREALDRMGFDKIELNSAARTVRFTRPGVEIDPGGIGKGYAVDRIVSILRQEGVVSAFVSASGSSLYGLGAPPSEPKGWRVHIRHPRDASRNIQEVFLKDESLSTSGAQEKFFEAGGRIYAHIMDPRTGYPAQGRVQVSVVAPRTLDSEAWTKPIFVQGRQWAAARKPKSLRAYICEDTQELSCAWLP